MQFELIAKCFFVLLLRLIKVFFSSWWRKVLNEQNPLSSFSWVNLASLSNLIRRRRWAKFFFSNLKSAFQLYMNTWNTWLLANRVAIKFNLITQIFKFSSNHTLERERERETSLSSSSSSYLSSSLHHHPSLQDNPIRYEFSWWNFFKIALFLHQQNILFSIEKWLWLCQ